MDDELTRALALPSRRSLLSLDHLTTCGRSWDRGDRARWRAPVIVGPPLAGKVIRTLFITFHPHRSSFTVAAVGFGNQLRPRRPPAEDRRDGG